MNYSKQTWAAGDKITSSKLNHMEDGIAAANTAIPLIVTEEEGFTYNELFSAMSINQPVYLKILDVSETDSTYERSLTFMALTELRESHEFEDETETYVECFADFSSWNHGLTYGANDLDEDMILGGGQP